MRLKSLGYKENIERADANPWELKDLSLRERNLIVAKNATGKTRILGSIHNLARQIQNTSNSNSWNLPKSYY
jgi:hypothetical protein